MPSPYAVGRSRWLILFGPVVMVASHFIVPTVSRGHWLGIDNASGRAVWLLVLDYGLGLALVAAWMRHAGLSWGRLFASTPTSMDMVRAGAMVFPLIGLTCVSVFGILALLSFAFPNVMKDLLLLLSDTPPPGGFLSLVSTVTSVALAPVVEEVLFRGILLPRWSVKWGLKTGVVASSLLFGLLHVDLLGALCFGYVAAVLTLRYRSLWPAVVMHVVNNATAEAVGALDARNGSSSGALSVAALRSFWWLALVGAAIGIPWLWWFARRHPWARVKEWAQAYGIA